MEIITGGKPFSGVITIPPSKSISHRALLAAGLSNTDCHVMSALDADDIEATLDCLLSLGVESQVTKSTLTNLALDINVLGNGAKWEKKSIVRSRESGSTLRFMIPIVHDSKIFSSLCHLRCGFMGFHPSGLHPRAGDNRRTTLD